MKKLFLSLVALFSLSAFADVNLTILHTNDHHGHYWKGRHGDYGMPARQTLIKRIRKEVKSGNGELLLLSGGDINTGTVASDIFKAKPDILAMNIMGYDAMAIGNHEFDNSGSILKDQMKWSKFPFLSANIRYKKSGKRAFTPYVIKKVGKYNVALVGLIAEDTPNKVLKKNVKDYKFTNAVKELKSLMPELKKKAKFVIVLSHMGWYKDGKHGLNAPGDVTLAKNVSGISAIVGGHTHEDLQPADIVNGTVIVQTGEWAKKLGRVDIKLKENGKVEYISSKKINVNLKKKIYVNGKKKRVFIDKEIPQDKELVKLLKPFHDEAQKKINIKIGVSNGLLDGTRKLVRSRQMPLGLFVAKALADISKADVAVINGGGVRSSLLEGDITLANLIQVNPFGNTICTIEVTGKELKNYMTGLAKVHKKDGAYPQMTDVELIFKNNKVSSFKIKGKPVKNKNKYILAIPNFSASGGDGYPDITSNKSFIDTGFTIDFALSKYIKKNNGKIDVKKYNRKYKVMF